MVPSTATHKKCLRRVANLPRTATLSSLPARTASLANTRLRGDWSADEVSWTAGSPGCPPVWGRRAKWLLANGRVRLLTAGRCRRRPRYVLPRHVRLERLIEVRRLHPLPLLGRQPTVNDSGFASHIKTLRLQSEDYSSGPEVLLSGGEWGERVLETCRTTAKVQRAIGLATQVRVRRGMGPDSLRIMWVESALKKIQPGLNTLRVYLFFDNSDRPPV